MSCLLGRYVETLHDDLVKMGNIDNLFVFLFILFYPITLPYWILFTIIMELVRVK